MGISLDGLVSGLKTAELIKSLMAVEAIPQTILQGKYTTTQNYLKTLQSLNSSVAKLAELGKNGLKADALELYAATSSDKSATVTIGKGAGATQLDITVEKLAQIRWRNVQFFTVNPRGHSNDAKYSRGYAMIQIGRASCRERV